MGKYFYNKKLMKDYRRKLRKSSTISEEILWDKLRNSQLGYKFRRQHSVSNYIVDFYCREVMLIIEIDGITHEDEAIFEKDQIRQKFLEEQGFEVIRFNTLEVFENINTLTETIFNICENRKV